jgi:exopolyphosphatase/guanosine-5'-triphosphate,3'-diphosphate pyrophosphatase
VRDAVNRDEFIARLRAASGHTLRVLDGEEEARLIGRGIACDPALRGVAAFYLFDLGGGSLEMLAFRDGDVAQLASVPLGCVRVTKQCVADPSRPLLPEEIENIRAHVRSTIASSSFRFDLGAGSAAVVTGGTATTFRAVRAAFVGMTFAEIGPILSTDEMAAFADKLCGLPIADRRAMSGLTAARADVFPAALLTLVEVARLAKARTLQHSLCNLRYGLALELLGEIE